MVDREEHQRKAVSSRCRAEKHRERSSISSCPRELLRVSRDRPVLGESLGAWRGQRHVRCVSGYIRWHLRSQHLAVDDRGLQERRIQHPRRVGHHTARPSHGLLSQGRPI